MKHFIYILFICVLFFIYAPILNLESSSIQEKEGTIQIDEGKLYYRSFGEGAPIIVVHGGPGLNHDYLFPQLLTLSEKYRLIFYDQRGSGKSLETEISPIRINTDQFVEDLERLRLSLEIDTFILMGHSWDGYLGMEYAIRYPEHLSKLILLNSSPADYEGQKAFLEKFVHESQSIAHDIKPLSSFEEFQKLNASEISNVYRSLFSIYFFDPSDVDKLNLSFNPISAQSGFQVQQIMNQTSWLHPKINLFPNLKHLSVPTLIISGRHDLVPVWTSEKIHNTIPQSEHKTLEKSGHFPYIEQPEEFFQTIHHYLEK